MKRFYKKLKIEKYLKNDKMARDHRLSNIFVAFTVQHKS